MNGMKFPRIPICAIAISALMLLSNDSPAGTDGRSALLPRTPLIKHDNPVQRDFDRIREVPQFNRANPARPLPHRDDPDEFFTFRYLVSDDGGESWSDILAAGDAGMYGRSEAGDPIPLWPEASYNFGVVASEENDLHFIAVLNAFSDEEELNPEGRENGVYDVRIDAEGASLYTLIAAEEDNAGMIWSDAGIDADGKIFALWVTKTNDRANFWAAYSEDRGESWSEPRRILADLNIGGGSDSELPYPHMTYHVGTYFYVIYQRPNPDTGYTDHRILRVPSSLEGNIVMQNPNASSANYLSYYVGSVSPIDQDVEQGWIYYAVRSQDNSATTIGYSNNNGGNWQTRSLAGAQRYPSVALDLENNKPWVFSNFGVGNPHRNWYSFDNQGYGGGDWIQPRALNEVEYDGIRDLLYCHQGVFTSENRLVSGCNIWGQFTPEGFATNYSDNPYQHEWAGMQRVWSIFDEEPLQAGYIPQNIIVAGGEDQVFIAFAAQYGETDFDGPTISNVTLSDFSLGGEWIVTAELYDPTGVDYSDVDFQISGQENWDYREPFSVEVDEFGNGTYSYQIPSDAINQRDLDRGDTVFFYVFAQDPLTNASESGMNIIIVDEGWIPAEPVVVEPEHYTEFHQSEVIHTVTITDILQDGRRVPPGWEAGVFTQEGLLAGACVWIGGEPVELSAYGDDPTTDVLDGFQRGEDMIFRLWDNRTEQEFATEVNLEEGSPQWQDGGETTVTLSVFVNRPPRWERYPESAEVLEGEIIRLRFVASDPDGDLVQFYIQRDGLPDSAYFRDDLDNSASLNWNTTFDDAGFYEPTFIITDGEYSDTLEVPIRVLNNYRPPTAFSLVSPENNFVWDQLNSIEFVWNASENPEPGLLRYHLMLLDEGDQFYSRGDFDAGSDTSLILSNDAILEILVDFDFIWSVTAVNDSDSTVCNEAFQIIVASGVGGDRLSPQEFGLNCYPNPFNSSTTIQFSFPPLLAGGELKGGSSLCVYDLSGRLVADLSHSAFRTPHSAFGRIIWEARDIPAGIYLVRLEAEGLAVTRKAVLMR